METYAVTSNTLSTATTDTASSANELSSEDFFELLVTELQQQDPLEPTGTSDIISQVSQIRTIEQSDALMTTLQQMTQVQYSSGATDMIGKYVEAQVLDSDGNVSVISGVVTGVLFASDGTAVLELDTGDAILASSVTRVTAPDTASVAESATDDDTDSSEDKSEATSRVKLDASNNIGTWLQSVLNL